MACKKKKAAVLGVVVLLLGHLAMVVGLALAARTERPAPHAMNPETSILNCLQR
jgi:hypothetical protein